MMKLKVYDRGDAIRYLTPILITACSNFAYEHIMPHDGARDMYVEVDYQQTIFSYTTNGINPKPMITIRSDDGIHDGYITIGAVFSEPNLFFKIEFKEINNDWHYVLKYCRDQWGCNEVDPGSIAFPLTAETQKLIELNNMLTRLVTLGTSVQCMKIVMGEKCDVMTNDHEGTEEGIQNETYPASGDVS